MDVGEENEKNTPIPAKKRWSKIQQINIGSVIAVSKSPELCIQLLARTPSRKVFLELKSKVENCSKEWLNEFIEIGGLTCLFESLAVLCHRRNEIFFTFLERLECVRCIKAVLNSNAGLEAMSRSNLLVRKLANGKRNE